MIRQLTTDDNNAVNELYKQLYPQTKETIDLSTNSFSAEYLPYVFEKDSRVIAYVTCVITQFGSLKQAVIEDLVVDQAYRRSGIGSKLVEAVISNLRSRHIDVVFVHASTSLPKENPVDFYQACGFKLMKGSWLEKVLN